ncbi:molybdenum cofactor guanylyltransferase [Candidatus Pelagibacter communis]|uniref:molybdenum cofactor guanylyltransferase n=1 Tax=Pelagibacter ubique TaxID=198252 RepID=UPI00094CEFA9|nr:molybdenum cofactor guanylyltransferase [Candidatus Pelagibacter ubique]|tara:strand:+ start:2349 stop:2960 length:612 start_codon:yes stop_codon:yes gene_type:complete
MNFNKILSVVLAGGKSKRFGEDKSQAKLAGKLLIDYILSELIDEFNEVLIVTNNSIKHMYSDKITKITDVKQNHGPLGGIFSAMKWVKDNKKSYKWIASFPADTPLFKIDIFKNFLNKINEKESELFFMKTDKKRHNIFGLWSIDLIDQLEKDLENGSRKVEKWANNIGVKTINMSFEKDDSFFNINTKEELEKAKKILDDQL